MTPRTGIVLGVVLLALLPVVIRDEYFLHVMVMIEINVVMAVSLWLLGITGLISFGQAGFMFIGAMTTALLMKLGGWSFWVSLPLSAMMAAAVSAPVGRLSLRVKGVYFFLITLAFGEVVRGVFAYFEHPFGGWYGIRDIPPPSPDTIFTGMGKMPFYYLGLALMLITCAVIYRVSRSWFGSVLWNIRESDVLAGSIGVDVPGFKLVAFIGSAFFSGLAGSFYATYIGYISPLVFTFEYSTNTLIFVVVGGFANIGGPIVGAVLLTLVAEGFRSIGKYQSMAFGLILVASVLLMPTGLVGAAQHWRERSQRRRHAVVPAADRQG